MAAVLPSELDTAMAAVLPYESELATAASVMSQEVTVAMQGLHCRRVRNDDAAAYAPCRCACYYVACVVMAVQVEGCTVQVEGCRTSATKNY